ncbi:hypothetical protein [uncultured Oscillibacter sp.]|uniref:hypothetical protein n=1 Tax=uncultured Oscillibacter sp. TaxID=876091 RepID=UPI0025FC5A7C|nr:hypothetical protein [uncultured Oscillibacter sp.]
MFKLMVLPDTEGFLNVVEHSRGRVLLHLPDDSTCDLKRDHTARQLLRVMRPGRDGLCISLSDARDVPGLLDYMIGSARQRG